CADKLILETILQDKFSYFKAEEGGVAVATATDANAEIRNLDARLFEKSTCWHTSIPFRQKKVQSKLKHLFCTFFLLPYAMIRFL
ncbi:MAG: hypothetical protein KH399_14300, partial [Ruminococcus sp.]|nr:hypothetical protein [Ruminococcus sp.]